MKELLIAPCGMNCALCAYYLAEQNKTKKNKVKIPYCPGCRIKKKICAPIIKHCILLRKGQVKYCFECKKFPCRYLKKLDKRYREHYHMSMIENNKFMKKHGIKKFLAAQKKTWRCPECGGTICCHNGLCFSCDLKKLKKRKRKSNKYRWEDK